MSKFSGAPYDLYSTLQVSEKASPSEIKRAYSQLAMQFHPDKPGGDEERFKEIQSAFDVLGDSSQKNLYDAYCKSEIDRLAAEEIFRQKKAGYSAVNTTRDPCNIRENFSEWMNQNLRENFWDVWSSTIDESLSKDITIAANNLSEKFAKLPYENIRIKLECAESLLKTQTPTQKDLQKILSDFAKTIPGTDISFWQNRLLHSQTDLFSAPQDAQSSGALIPAPDGANGNIPGGSGEDMPGGMGGMAGLGLHILESWRNAYEKMLMQWMLGELESAKQGLRSKYLGLLNNLRQIKKAFKGLPNLGWDLSLTDLKREDINVVMAWADVFRNNTKIRKLCEILGNLYKESTRDEREKITTTLSYENIVPDCNSKEEISGIIFGNKIENALPQELALLGDEETSLLFDLKFIENRLMCFDKHGYVSQRDDEKIEEDNSTGKKKEKGPIILCVDTSGSMSGFPESVAKAIALHMASIAHKQNRPCYLISFSTEITTFDFSRSKGLKELVEFLELTFDGGTDVTPALEKGLELMQEGEYKNADMLVISDFIFPLYDTSLKKKIRAQQKQDNAFYALSILKHSQTPFDYYDEEKQQLFDEAWVFSSKNKTIRQLYSKLKKIAERRHNSKK